MKSDKICLTLTEKKPDGKPMISITADTREL